MQLWQEIERLRGQSRRLASSSKRDTSRRRAAMWVNLAATHPQTRRHGRVAIIVFEKPSPAVASASDGSRIQESMHPNAIELAELVSESCCGSNGRLADNVTAKVVAAASVVDCRHLSYAPRCLSATYEASQALRLGTAVRQGKATRRGTRASACFIRRAPWRMCQQPVLCQPRNGRRAAAYAAENRGVCRGSREKVTQDAAMLKLFRMAASGSAHRGVQLRGATSFMRDHIVERACRKARMSRIIEGTSETQQLLTARGVSEGSWAS